MVPSVGSIRCRVEQELTWMEFDRDASLAGQGLSSESQESAV